MAVEKEIIVALEFGSSKLRGVAGCKNTDGSIEVLDVQQTDARNCIRNGRVYNIDKTVMCLKGIVDRIESALGKQVCKVYVGIGGQSLRTKKNSVTRKFAAKTVVSQELVDSLLKSNSNTVYPGYEILEVIPQEYRVGQDNTIDPVGVLSSQIEGNFLNVIIKTEVKEYILKCVEAAGLEVAGVSVSPNALAGCVLTEGEKRSGCALVDCGYGTTTVAVYKNSLLRHLAVIPLGGNSITQDLCSQQIDEDEAENLKIKYGSACSDENGEELTRNLVVNNGRAIEERSLVDIVEARQEEILSNVAAQIRNSGYQDNLLAGVVLSGAAANIKNMDKAVIARIHPTKIRFVASLPELKLAHVDMAAKDGSLNCLFSLLGGGTLNCVKDPAPVAPAPVVEEEVKPEPVKVEVQPEPVAPEPEKEYEEEENERKGKKNFLKKLKEKIEVLTRTVTEE